jgi:hypothetical protein
MAVGGVWEDSWGKGGCADWTGFRGALFFVVLEIRRRIWGSWIWNGWASHGTCLEPLTLPARQA